MLKYKEKKGKYIHYDHFYVVV